MSRFRASESMSFPILILIFYLFLLSIPLSAKVPVSETKVNLLLITIDTLRADRLSCYNSNYVNTPNIDDLAARSALFTKAFAHTSTTLPSHTNILVGKIPPSHGVHDNLNFRLKAEYLTLAEHLKNYGYSTGAFVGAFPLKSLYGLDQGFDIYDDDFGLAAGGEAASERLAEIVIDSALRYLDQAKAPWFVWIHCYDPHDPYEPPQPFASQYETSRYDGEVAYVDFALKKLFDYLKIHDLYSESAIVFTGDHGESLGEHEEKRHGFFAYNSTIQVPLLIYFPGLKPQIVSQNVSHMDLFPTICSLLKIERPSDLSGTVLLPFKKQKNLDQRIIYFESMLPFYNMGWAPIRGIVRGRSKFIDSPLPEFYDLDKDFEEMKDLAGQTNLEPYRKQLSQILQNHESDNRKADQGIDRLSLDRLRSLGYVGDYLGEIKKSFGPDDDVKVLLPFYNKTQDALDLLHEKGKVREATNLLKEVITESKRYPLAFVNLAEIYKNQNRLSEAIQVLRIGLDNIPESFQLFSTLIEYLFDAYQWNDVIALFQQNSFNRFEFDPEIWNLLGTAYANIGDFENARICSERAVAIDETFPNSYISLGKIYFSLFNLSTNPDALEKALQNYQKAIELDPKISAAHEGLGLVHMYRNNFERAIIHFENALRLQPDLDSALYNLGIVNLKMGNKEAALSNFTKFKLSASYKYLPANDKAKVEDLIRQCRENLAGC